jgi:hypothetical protein
MRVGLQAVGRRAAPVTDSSAPANVAVPVWFADPQGTVLPAAEERGAG